MRGWFKAKDSYKSISEDESYKCVAFRKHEALLRGEIVYIETAPRLINKDFSEHLEACDEPVKESPPEEAKEVVEKSAEPSDSWTKDELKVYMDDNSISYNSGDTKSDLLDKINKGGD